MFFRIINYAKKRFLYILLFIMYIIESKMDIIAENGPDICKFLKKSETLGVSVFFRDLLIMVKNDSFIYYFL